LCTKLLRGEKRDLDDSEEAIKTLANKDNKKQPETKKQTILGEENFSTSRAKNYLLKNSRKNLIY